MSPEHKSETKPLWWYGLVVINATTVSYVGFAHVSVKWTLAISSVVLVGLVIFLWFAEVRPKRLGRVGDRP